ncbi:MAG: rhamnan synthesis F family protein [Janthinobacterium lividum]
MKDLSDDLRQAIKERLTPAAIDVRKRWQKMPTLGRDERWCLLVTVLRNGRVVPHALHQARTWVAEGFRLILIAVTDEIDSPLDGEPAALADGILLRANQGYDFGAWSAAIQALPALHDAALLVTTNDSMFGPLDGFRALLDRVYASDADLIGLTDSNYHRRHFQSYLLFYKPHALRHVAFWRFWRRIRTGDRWMVIVRYETRLLKVFTHAGLSGEVLFPTSGGPAATLKGWKALVERGFPFVKVQLLRDNPFDDDIADWETFLQRRGYDPQHCYALLASS